LYRVVENIEKILSIELMSASQALSFRKAPSSDFIESFVTSFRQDVAVLSTDVVLHNEMKKSQEFLQNLSLEESLLY
jgi:histidine ammonia-lyase